MGIASFLTLVLIKGGLICQQNVRTATLSQGGAYSEGGAYMPVNTVCSFESTLSGSCGTSPVAAKLLWILAILAACMRAIWYAGRKSYLSI
jgi:hypothetical protein